MRAPLVVVPGVLGERALEVAWAEDQHAGGELGAGGEHEPLGVGVGPWTTRRDGEDLDARIGEDGVERGGELAGPVPDEEPERLRTRAEVQQEVAGLLGGPRPVGVGGDAEDVHVPGLDLQREQHVHPPQGHRVDVEEVDRQRGRRLGAQELPPAQVAAAGRCWRDPGPP
jgi:hypothetical protein